MIRRLNNLFVLDTADTTYAFRVLPTGQLEHLYYGKRIRIEEEADAMPLVEQHAFVSGNLNLYDKEHTEFSLEDMRLEMSSYGKGDIREPMVELIKSDGSMTCDFTFSDAKILEEKRPLATLPSAYAPEEIHASELIITLQDEALSMELCYSVFEETNVITRSAKLLNNGQDPVRLERLLSMQFDLDPANYQVTCFTGAWAREMQKKTVPVEAGKLLLSSMTGSSSSRCNPFFMVSKAETTEENGDCYGCNLIYSGNHYESVEVSSYGKVRVSSGINPTQFSFLIGAGESFETPEAVLTFSAEGFGGMSRNMHAFVRKCIVRGRWKEKERPVLINSWEAAYFDINESKLLKLAKAAKEVGVELFVMDDGWFGKRDNDTSSLGDWTVNEKKLPGGLSGLADKINGLGLDFGIWVEPEMVNADSDLYRTHPEWTIDIPGRDHSEGRNQRILDFCNPKVVSYMTDVMRKVFKSANIAYVKWDMNRTFTDVYSKYLPADRQGEVLHRYIMGVYEMMGTLTTEFPEILFEGCAAGGNRFDLGILCYFPQIWASDDTDAIYRAKAQTNYSYGYPMSTLSAHVSNCPNHQTLRVTPLATRFAVAAFGICGYECNLAEMKGADLSEIKKQINLYKKYRKTLQFGTFYRSACAEDIEGIYQWTSVSEDKKEAVGMFLHTLVQPNTRLHMYRPRGLDPTKKYHFTNREMEYDIREFGDLINTAAPIHVKPNSLMHNAIANFVKMPGETEDIYAYGDALMSGIHLKEAFGATGYDERTRHFPDFAARLLFLSIHD